MAAKDKKIKLNFFVFSWFIFWEMKYLKHVEKCRNHTPYPLNPWDKVAFCLGISENLMLAMKEQSKVNPAPSPTEV